MVSPTVFMVEGIKRMCMCCLVSSLSVYIAAQAVYMKCVAQVIRRLNVVKLLLGLGKVGACSELKSSSLHQ